MEAAAQMPLREMGRGHLVLPAVARVRTPNGASADASLVREAGGLIASRGDGPLGLLWSPLWG